MAYVMHRLIPLATRTSPISVNGRVYNPAAGAIDVPEFDSAILQANGWALLATAGSEATAPSSPQVGNAYWDEDVGQFITWDGKNWRDPSGALVTLSQVGMTQIAFANQIFQRDTVSGGAGQGAGTVPLTIRPYKTGNVFARTRKVSDGTIDQAQWTAGTVASTASQTFSVAGVNARLGWFYLDLSQDGVTWALGTTPIGMGVLVVSAGQSLEVALFQKNSPGTDPVTITGAGATISDNVRIFCNPGGANVPTSWAQSSDAGSLSGAGAAELGYRLTQIANCNVGLVSVNQGGTQTSQWLSGQALNTALLSTMDLAGGKFEIVRWHNGHSDAANNVSDKTYQANLTSIFGNMVAHNGFASPQKMVTSIANFSGTGFGLTWQKEVIRRASYNWAVANGAIVSMFNDLPLLSDGTHETNAGSVTLARHIYRALRPYFGAAHNDNGITLGAATHAAGSPNIVIPYSLPSGATTLVPAGDPSKIFKVFQGGDRASPLAFDATTPFAFDNVAKTITLKLAADPGQVPLSILPFGVNDAVANGSTNNIYDDLTDGDGITVGREMLFTPNPILIGGNRNLTGGGTPTYGAGKFGNTLTQGYGTIAAPATPGIGTGLTIDFWFKVITSDSSTLRTLFGSLAGIELGVQGTNLVLKTDTAANVTFTAVATVGSWQHGRIVLEPGLIANPDVKLYVDGTQRSSSGPASFFTSWVANNLWAIRKASNSGFSDAAATELIDEIAIFQGALNTANFTPPTAAWVGNEANLVALYHLDGDLTNSAA